MRQRKNTGRKILCGAIFALLLACALTLGVCAEENKMPDEYKDFLDSLPNDAASSLPEGIYSEDAQEVADAVSRMSGVEYLFSLLIQGFGSGLSRVIPQLALVVGLLTASAVGGLLSTHFSPSAAKIYGLCSRLALFCAIGGVAVSVLLNVKAFLSRLCATVSAFVPLSATLYTMGGNIGAATKSGAGLLFTLGAVEFISGAVVVPLFCFCLCMSLVSCASADIGSVSLGGGVKKAFLSVLGIITMILSLSLSSQTLISAKADSLAMKGAKMFLGGIPVTGGTVSSSLGTLASSVELIRGTVGVGGIIILLMLLLPTLIELWLMRGMYSLLGSFSGMLGMAGEQRLLTEVSELYGILEGVAIMCSVVFFVAMGVLCTSAPAIA